MRLRLTIIDFNLAPSLPSDSSCPIPLLCQAAQFDTFALTTTIWATLQLTWTSILLIVQLVQIGREMTTLEVSNLGRYGFMGGAGERGTKQVGAEGGEGEVEHVHGVECDQAKPPTSSSSSSTQSNFLLKILGIDRFTKDKKTVRALTSVGVNPFHQGIFRNCLNFWGEEKVDWRRVYEVPPPPSTALNGIRERRNQRGEEGYERVLLEVV